jgi:hypothetical protein
MAQHVLHEADTAGDALIRPQAQVSDAAARAGDAAVSATSTVLSGQMKCATAASRAALSGVQEMHGAIMEGLTGALCTNIEAAQVFLRCGNVEEISTLQGRFLLRQAELSMETSWRVFRVTRRAAFGAWGVPSSNFEQVPHA